MMTEHFYNLMLVGKLGVSADEVRQIRDFNTSMYVGFGRPKQSPQMRSIRKVGDNWVSENLSASSLEKLFGDLPKPPPKPVQPTRIRHDRGTTAGMTAHA
jgi:hypothetical protein